ncbi:MAG: nuclear transport factor 2 family protein [Terriglobales bacterium]
MMRTLVLGTALGLASLTILPSQAADFAAVPLTASQRQELLAAREKVWRAWFGNDQKVLEQLLPAETLAINNGEEAWENREAVLRGAREFASGGGRLVRLEFPRVEIQSYGDVAVIYSLYSFETETKGVRTTSSGRATEVFVRENGRWTNPGWHMDSGK